MTQEWCQVISGTCRVYERDRCGVCGRFVSWCSIHKRPTALDACWCRTGKKEGAA